MPSTGGTTSTISLPRLRIKSASAHVWAMAGSAFLLMLAFPQPGWGWFAHIALVPSTVLALRSHAPRRLIWASYAMALAWWLVMLRWLTGVTFPGYLGLCAYMALYWPAALLILRFLDMRYRPPMAIALPMVWVSLELIRGTILAGGFGWFALGHSQAPNQVSEAMPWFIQVADLFGEAGVSLLVAMTNGAIVDVLVRPVAKGKGIGRTALRWTARHSLIAWAICLVAANAYGIYRTGQWDEVTQAGPVVAVVQTNVPQDNKNLPTEEQVREDWLDVVRLTREAAAISPAPSVIVWPETTVPTAINPDAIAFYESLGRAGEPHAAYHRQLGELAAATGSHLIVGAPSYHDFKRFSDDDGKTWYLRPTRRYNAAFAYRPDGVQAMRHYAKIHRVPFGEYIPWIDAMPWLRDGFLQYLTPYDSDYTIAAGQSWTVFTFDMGPEDAEAISGPRAQEIRIATPICFEDAVPRVIRRMAYKPSGDKAIDLLVNLTNDGWFAGSHQPLQHMQIATLRCVENRVPAARAVNTGVSGFIDSLGRIRRLVEVGGEHYDVEGVATHQVMLDARETLFGRIGRLPGTLLLLATTAMVAAGLVWRPRSI